MTTTPPLTSILTWHKPEEEMPDKEDGMLIYVKHSPCEPGCEIAFWHKGLRQLVDDHGLRINTMAVLLWADMPEPPEVK